VVVVVVFILCELNEIGKEVIGGIMSGLNLDRSLPGASLFLGSVIVVVVRLVIISILGSRSAALDSRSEIEMFFRYSDPKLGGFIDDLLLVEVELGHNLGIRDGRIAGRVLEIVEWLLDALVDGAIVG
jgi:hypothetical protein